MSRLSMISVFLVVFVLALAACGGDETPEPTPTSPPPTQAPAQEPTQAPTEAPTAAVSENRGCRKPA